MWRVTSGKDDILFFPRKFTTDKVAVENPFVSLSAFTVAVWVQMDADTDYHSVFSYAVSGNPNELVMYPTSSLTRIIINKSYLDSNVVLVDGYWHHIAVTWENTAGNWILYINGSKINEGTKHAGHTIIKGALILGQEQDSYMGDFQTFQSLQGNLTSFNMWNKVLSPVEIASIAAKRCSSSPEGNAVKWRDLKDKLFGNVKLTCKSFCG
ncbi:hypothetical protein QZH41_013392 [Actinostola sp. cb2023]|nr:hypothetical protein QZH41_013392 [Actinostola sp. cb2023]